MPEGLQARPGADAVPPRETGEEWIRALPKAEVHCHLEGCIDRQLIGRAAARRGVPLPWDEAEESGGTIGSLAELLAYLEVSCGLIEQPHELAAIAYGASALAAASGTRQLDVIVTPLHWQAWRERLPAMVDALDGGFREAEEDGLAPAGLCLSISRRQSAAAARQLVEWMLSARHPRVVALSLDGDEREGSHNERFAEAFALAAAGGLHRCAHAGESSGPEGVREAVEVLGAERIDHGIRALEDRSVVDLLASRAIPLDICPSSNRILGLVPDPALHPVERLRSAGVRVSLNTDDPLIYGIDLAGEYSATARTFGWGRGELASVARTSLESCFADEGRRSELVRELEAFLGAAGEV